MKKIVFGVIVGLTLLCQSAIDSEVSKVLNDQVELMRIVPEIESSTRPEFFDKVRMSISVYPTSDAIRKEMLDDVNYWIICSTNSPTSFTNRLNDADTNMFPISSLWQVVQKPGIEPRGYTGQSASAIGFEERVGGWCYYRFVNMCFIIRIKDSESKNRFMYKSKESKLVEWRGMIEEAKRYVSYIDALKDFKYVDDSDKKNCNIVLYKVSEVWEQPPTYMPISVYDVPVK